MGVGSSVGVGDRWVREGLLVGRSRGEGQVGGKREEWVAMGVGRERGGNDWDRRSNDRR